MSKSGIPDLRFEQQVAIWHGLASIGDDVLERYDLLQDQGHSAFVPAEEYWRSFAADDSELEQHRKFTREFAKWTLGRPLSKTDEQQKLLVYPSGYQELIDARDRLNGATDADFSTKYPDGADWWRRELDPCQRRRMYLYNHAREEFDVSLTAMRERVHERLSREASMHVTGLSRHFELLPTDGQNYWAYISAWAPSHARRVMQKDGLPTANPGDRLAFVKAVLGRDLPPLGFRYNGSKSRPTRPVYSKPLSVDWELTYGLDLGSLFLEPTKGSFSPVVHLRSRGDRSEPRRDRSQELGYGLACPSFGAGYSEFRSLDELETIIRAHLCLYGMVEPMIIAAIMNVLG